MKVLIQINFLATTANIIQKKKFENKNLMDFESTFADSIKNGDINRIKTLNIDQESVNDIVYIIFLFF